MNSRTKMERVRIRYPPRLLAKISFISVILLLNLLKTDARLSLTMLT